MTALVQELLDNFDRLTDSERMDLTVEILKRTAHLELPPLSGVFDVQNIVTIPDAKLLRKLGGLTSEQMEEIAEVLLFWLGFDDSEEIDD